MDTLWQAGLSNAVSATFLALLVACLARVIARRPAVLHCLWLLVLIKLVTPPLVHVPLPWSDPFLAEQERVVTVLELERVPLEPSTAVGAVDVPRTPAVAGILMPAPLFVWKELSQIIWLGGILTTLVVVAWRIARFQVLLREAVPVDPELQDWVDELAMCVGVVRLPSVWWLGGKVSPMVWSLGRRPRLLIPIDLWKGLDQRQRSTLLIHELAHLRRGDHHVRFLELVVTALYWWHPVVWLARRALRAVEEQCCDAWVVWAFPDATKSYAETLLETLDFLDHSDLSEPLLASGFGRVRHLRKRLTMIMNGATPRLVGVWGNLGSLALAVLLLPMNPSRAQQAESDDKTEVRVVVRTADGADAPQIVTFVPDDTVPKYVVTEVVSRIDAGEAGKVILELKTDGLATTVTADSIDEAIDKLRQQIKGISQKTPVTDTDRHAIKALEGAIRGLENSEKTVVRPKAGSHKADAVKKLMVRLQDVKVNTKVHSGGAATTGTKADIEAERRKIEKLTQALREHQHELAEATLKLAELQALATAEQQRDHAESNLARVRSRPVRQAETSTTISTGLPGGTATSGSTSTSISSSGSTSTSTGGGASPSTSSSSGSSGGVRARKTVAVHARPVTSPPQADTDQKRLAELEKKLDQLLEEVANLKKARAK